MASVAPPPAARAWRGRDDRLPVEHLADHARPLQTARLTRRPADPGGLPSSADTPAGMGTSARSSVASHRSSERTSNLRSISLRDELLYEQRVAPGGSGDAACRLGRHAGAAEEVADQPATLVLAERLERHHRDLGAAGPPVRAVVKRLGSGDADDQDGGIVGEAGYMLKEVE